MRAFALSGGGTLAACNGTTARVVVLPSSCPVAVGPLDFSQAERLFVLAREQSAAFLQAAEVEL